MKNKIDIEKFLNQDWYVQGFNAVPIFLNPAVWSGIEIKKELGFSYTNFFASYKNGYGEVGYLSDDFGRIWKIVKRKIEKNPNYIQSIRKKYFEKFNKYEKLFKKINNKNFSKLNNEELLDIFQQCMNAQIDSVGLAHIVESVGMEIEKELSEMLFEKICISDAKVFNKYISILTTPTEKSFIAKEEKELLEIVKLKGSIKKEKIEKHLRKYFWIMNSYAGPFRIDMKFLEKRIKNLSKIKKTNLSSRIKKDLIKKLKLNGKIIAVIKLVDFITIFQDERKANILKAIGYFDVVIREISKRASISKNLLYYLCVSDFEKINSIEDIKKTKNLLNQRIKGVYSVVDGNGEHNFSGKDYGKINKLWRKIEKKDTKIRKDIHGISANLGKAIGRVRICKNISSIGNVQEDDILVASMTRPEFMLAIKKSAGIVTDEGGITCHAAIISRELGKPCIIGTKIATQVLKDGDLVEVNANHGIVKILK